MAERAKTGEIKKVAVAGGKDPFEDLPEPVLEMLLSFLPSRDAVRTSVLARRWRTLWKSVPALRFYPSQFESAQAFNSFVNKLLEHRECEITPYPHGWAPFLESLPSLVTSFIRIGEDCVDNLAHYNYLGDSESCEDGCCVLLEGLAGATNLELISECSVLFRKDLKWCPMFSKLRTVLLNEWCLHANFTGLLYFLQHTPILE